MGGFLPGQNLVNKRQKPLSQNQAKAGKQRLCPGGGSQGGSQGGRCGPGRPEPDGPSMALASCLQEAGSSCRITKHYK